MRRRRGWLKQKQHPEMEPWDEVPKEDFDANTTEEFFEKVDERVRVREGVTNLGVGVMAQTLGMFRRLSSNERVKIPLYDGEREELQTFAYDRVDIYRGAQPNR